MVLPEQALLSVQKVQDRFTIVNLEEDEYDGTIAQAAGRGFTSDRIYDALLLHCAAKVKADAIYTWNLKPYRAIDPKLADKGSNAIAAGARAQGFLIGEDRGLFSTPENVLFSGIGECNGWGPLEIWLPDTPPRIRLQPEAFSFNGKHLPREDNREKMVGARGFEPPASWTRTRRSTRLSHAPNSY